MASPNAKATEKLQIAARIGDHASFIKAIREGANVNATDGDKLTALHWAAAGGRPEDVKELLSAGAAVDTQTDHGWTALMYAASFLSEFEGCRLCVQILLAAGANQHLTTLDGRTAVQMAEAFAAGKADEGDVQARLVFEMGMSAVMLDFADTKRGQAAVVPSPAAGLSFGASAPAAAAAGISFGAPAAAPSSAAGFAFGASAATPSSAAGFTFGAPAAAPSSAAGFAFGAPAAAPSAAAGASFGSSVPAAAPSSGFSPASPSYTPTPPSYSPTGTYNPTSPSYLPTAPAPAAPAFGASMAQSSSPQMSDAHVNVIVTAPPSVPEMHASAISQMQSTAFQMQVWLVLERLFSSAHGQKLHDILSGIGQQHGQRGEVCLPSLLPFVEVLVSVKGCAVSPERECVPWAGANGIAFSWHEVRVPAGVCGSLEAHVRVVADGGLVYDEQFLINRRTADEGSLVEAVQAVQVAKQPLVHEKPTAHSTVAANVEGDCSLFLRAASSTPAHGESSMGGGFGEREMYGTMYGRLRATIEQQVQMMARSAEARVVHVISTRFKSPSFEWALMVREAMAEAPGTFCYNPNTDNLIIEGHHRDAANNVRPPPTRLPGSTQLLGHSPDRSLQNSQLP